MVAAKEEIALAKMRSPETSALTSKANVDLDRSVSKLQTIKKKTVLVLETQAEELVDGLLCTHGDHRRPQLHREIEPGDDFSRW